MVGMQGKGCRGPRQLSTCEKSSSLVCLSLNMFLLSYSMSNLYNYQEFYTLILPKTH